MLNGAAEVVGGLGEEDIIEFPGLLLALLLPMLVEFVKLLLKTPLIPLKPPLLMLPRVPLLMHDVCCPPVPKLRQAALSINCVTALKKSEITADGLNPSRP